MRRDAEEAAGRPRDQVGGVAKEISLPPSVGETRVVIVNTSRFRGESVKLVNKDQPESAYRMLFARGVRKSGCGIRGRLGNSAASFYTEAGIAAGM